MSRDRTTGHDGGLAVCHRQGLQQQLLFVQASEELQALFFLFHADNSAVMLCTIYRPPSQGSAPFTFLTDQLDFVMTTHGCQNIAIVDDMNQYLMRSALN